MGFNWKLYLTLLIATAISILAVLPYAFTLAGDTLKEATLPLPAIVALSVLQSTVLFTLVIYFGLRLSKKTGLGLPYLERFLAGKKTDIRTIVPISVLSGIAVGILIIIADRLFSAGISLGAGSPPFWMGLLASLYGGIAEEILLRLFFMTLLVWLLGKLVKGDVLKNNYIMWSSIIIASVVFGLGHLPITASVTAITPLVVARAIVLNGIGGIVFGWLYWKKGLESAMIAHFSADIVLHVLLPLIAAI